MKKECYCSLHSFLERSPAQEGITWKLHRFLQITQTTVTAKKITRHFLIHADYMPLNRQFEVLKIVIYLIKVIYLYVKCVYLFMALWLHIDIVNIDETTNAEKLQYR